MTDEKASVGVSVMIIAAIEKMRTPAKIETLGSTG